MLTWFLFAIAVAVVAWLVLAPIVRSRRRDRLTHSEFPEAWHQLLFNRWRLYCHLPLSVRVRIQRQLQVMLPETDFYGCDGVVVTEEMKVLILAQAALLYGNVLEEGGRDFPVVLIYPGAFVRHGQAVDALGLVSEERHELLGESWEQGKVILSWDDVERGADRLDGHNLVIHEYAHQIDGYDGSMNGSPPLGGRQIFAAWPAIMQTAYDDLCNRVEERGDASIDPYATTNPGEFFAVISETFFTRPEALQQDYPEVYQQLAAFYQEDPLSWIADCRME
ncbi:M90 family metallopeptidase [Cellvibrio polysaccharolyticus]|uniref:Protein MtfA n=1 Tax=Cellvibrio polysaccharolyticus TaxID=2082724 RepID=A0A928V8M7_9GAMM|nr:M90 family metallopeptidase [Cellvibrio polysaccharolyticus]MBE8718926.1 hypothetical protein [Cellvibrio polysaccharolyticus]